MILYFSATGNNEFAAHILAGELKDRTVSVNDILKQRKQWKFYSETPFVFVVPIYAWRIPAQIEEMLKKAEFRGNSAIYIVATMGEHAARAGEYCRKICKRRGLDYGGFAAIQMPDNYLVDNVMPSREEAVREVKKAVPVLKKTAALIREGKKLPEAGGRKKGDWFLSGPVCWGFRNFMVPFSRFSVSEACVACGKCVRECPVNNITLTDGKIRFGSKCMFCLGCIHKCPAHAIDYKGRAKKNGYYQCPSLTEVQEEEKSL